MWKFIKKIIAKIGDAIEFIVTPAPSMEELLNNPNDTEEVKAYKTELMRIFIFGKCDEEYLDELSKIVWEQAQEKK